jgi:formate hydrogenlyase subunit 4
VNAALLDRALHLAPLLAERALHVAVLLVLPPLLPGVVNRVKAIVAGRRGPPLLQGYSDLAKLLRKGAVYSRTTTWIFRAGPVVGLAAVLAAGLLLPLAGRSAVLSFPGDVIAFAALLGLGRFFTVLAALDTGSAFEGMGASREASFSVFAEPVLFLVLATLCVAAGAAGFGEVLEPVGTAAAALRHPVLLVAAAALFAVLLAENARIPVDDPNTHLELTMIHEVMVLDHGGPDLAFIQYGAAVKLFLFSALLAHLVLPFPAGVAGAAVLVLGVLGAAVGVGLVESGMARLRMTRVPQFLAGAGALAALALAVLLTRGR